MNAIPNVLAVAGSDSGAGAGVQADLKTFAALRVYGCAAITAITAQNTIEVTRSVPVSAGMVEAQMEAVLRDVPVAAVKIGMLPTSLVVRAVAGVLARHEVRNVVYDPVMTASTGRALQTASALRSVRELLLPRVLIATPNVAELVRLSDVSSSSPMRGAREIDRAVRQLRGRCAGAPPWVLVTGGDGDGRESRDRLHGPFAPDGAMSGQWYRARRIETRHGHGTGCTLSSAIAARLALGDDVPQAVEAAKQYLSGALAAADELAVGHGPGPLNHFFALWEQT